MIYDGVFNNPYEKRRITYSHVWWNAAFEEEELKQIENICSSSSLENASTVNEENLEKTRLIRKSQVKFFDRDENNFWIFDRFNLISNKINNKYYNFELYGYSSFQYTVYNSEYLGNYDWHMDTILDNNFDNSMQNQSTRKLTLVMPLSEPGKDFTGGEFELNLGQEKNPITIEMQKGKIIAFPSFMIHRVKPVLTGVRKSIVIWIEGPKFK